MSVELWMTAFSTLISLAGWLLVVAQLREGNDQRRMEALLQIAGINREIVALGFANPELFQVLHGRKADPVATQHYLQLWFNQFALIHSFQQRKLFTPELRAGLERDIREFMTQENALRHWQQKRQFYPASFQTYVDGLIDEKAGVPPERPPRKHRLRGR